MPRSEKIAPAGAPVPVTAAENAAPAAAAEPGNLRDKIAAAMEGVADYVYVEVEHDGQTYSAWRSANGTVHVENRGF